MPFIKFIFFIFEESIEFTVAHILYEPVATIVDNKKSCSILFILSNFKMFLPPVFTNRVFYIKSINRQKLGMKSTQRR